MVNAPDVYQFSGGRWIDVRQAVPRSHALDAHSMLHYLTVPGQKSIRKSNFTQTAPNLQPRGPHSTVVVQHRASMSASDLSRSRPVAVTEGGGLVWADPSPPAPASAECCQVQNGPDPTVTLLAHDAWAVPTVSTSWCAAGRNCKTNQLELRYNLRHRRRSAPSQTRP